MPELNVFQTLLFARTLRIWPVSGLVGILWCIGLCLALVTGKALAAEVILATLQAQGEQAHVELLLDQPVRYRLFALENPYRVVLDLESVSLNATLKALPPQLSSQHPYLSKLRIAPFSDSVTRLVFDIKGSSKPQFIDLNPNAGQQQRLAITIAPLQAAVIQSTTDTTNKNVPTDKPINTSTVSPSQSAANSAESSPAFATPASVTPNGEPVSNANTSANKAPDNKTTDNKTTDSKTLDSKSADNKESDAGDAAPVSRPPKKAKAGQRLITIAVDAGHGGEDPGARGANGSHEKNITLAIAQRLKAQIDAEEDMQAILIRDGDYFVPLGDRVKKARAAKADLFISIHADSFINSSAKGSSVFALSERGATSAGARYLAKKENEVDLIGGIPLNTKDMDLARTLLDLSQTATIHDSIRLGKAVLKRIAKINSLHSNYVEQAAFAVLKAPDIPSILVETAFISNPDEEARLNDDEYQNKLVAAILGGVKAFVATNPAFAKR